MGRPGRRLPHRKRLGRAGPRKEWSDVMKKTAPLLVLSAVLLAACDGLYNSGEILAYEEPAREWTFIVYIAADNGLDAAALEVVNGLEAAVRDKMPVAVIALVDRIAATPENWSDTRLYEIKPDPNGNNAGIVSTRLDGSPELAVTAGSGGELNTASPLVLSGLIDFAKRAYPAENYGLVVWGHGLGWKGFIVDDTSGASMPLPSFGAAVADKGLAVIAFDTGLGVTLESAYELRKAAHYLIGSPNGRAGQGWDYETLFASFLDSPSLTAEAFCESAAGQFQSQYSSTSGAALSVIDLSKTGALFARFESFSGALAGTVSSLSARDSLYAKFVYGTIDTWNAGGVYPSDTYADIYSLSMLGDGTALRNALSAAVSSWSKEHETGRALLGVFVNRLASPVLFAPSHEDGYKRGTGTGAFVKDSENWVPAGNAAGTSFLDRLFYGEYN